LYLGSRDSVEERLAARAGVAFQAIDTGQLRGRGPWTVAKNLWLMRRGLTRSARLVRSFVPDVVFVTGGYVCAPVVVASRRLGHPVLIYLPDLTPGLAVRLLSRMANQVAVTYPETTPFFPGKAIVTGYPIRAALQRLSGRRVEARRALDLDPELKTLLVFGGSHGARSLNRALTGSLEAILPACQVIHISGQLDWPWVQEEQSRLPDALRVRYRPCAYLHDEMALALAAADLVVSRSGAATLGEYPALGLPSLLVPYPHAGRHQEANALYLSSRGAAQVMDDEALETDLLTSVLSLLGDDEKLRQMRERALALAQPAAAQRIGDALAALAQASVAEGTERG